MSTATVAVFAVLTQALAPFAIDFGDAGAREQVHLLGRQSHLPDDGRVVLRGGGSVYARAQTGPGVFQVRFAMIEAERFQYHVPRLDLFKADPQDPRSNGYSLGWQPHGLLRFTALSGGDIVHSRVFIHPGRENPNRYRSGDVVDLAVRVPPAGDCIEVFCHRERAAGEPTVRFKLAGLPLEGHFGWHNDKWFSHAHVYRLRHAPD